MRLSVAAISWFVGVTGAGVASGWAALEPAAQRPQLPRFDEFRADPQEMLDRLFGPPTDQDKAALAKIDVTVQEERRMGQAAVDAYLAELQRQGIRVVRRGKDVAYLQELIRALRPFTTNLTRYPEIQVYVAHTPRCDARAFPGGTLVFFHGLLESAGSEAALVGIIGHELSHLEREHLLGRARRIKQAQTAFSEAGPGMSPDRFWSAGASSLRLWTRPFQPEDEREADRDGARWAYQAGYDPQEMARLLVQAAERQGLGRLPLPQFLQSHPAAAERRDAILRVYAELQRTQPRAPLGVGRENLRRRIPLSRQRWPE